MDQIPFGKEFEGALRSFIKGGSKRIAGQVGTAYTRGLAAATEPFFRRNMGERHFSANSMQLGMALWIAATIMSCLVTSFFNGLWALSALLAGIAVAVVFWMMASESVRQVAQIREAGMTYHTRSRGTPRWDAQTETMIQFGGAVLLLILSPFVGIAFSMSLGISSMLAAQLEASLRERYLDALDAQIEAQLLEDALLGKRPPEITYIYKPLPADMNPELRENIAAAAVGKPVKIVAQAPQPK